MMEDTSIDGTVLIDCEASHFSPFLPDPVARDGQGRATWPVALFLR